MHWDLWLAPILETLGPQLDEWCVLQLVSRCWHTYVVKWRRYVHLAPSQRQAYVFRRQLAAFRSRFVDVRECGSLPLSCIASLLHPKVTSLTLFLLRNETMFTFVRELSQLEDLRLTLSVELPSDLLLSLSRLRTLCLCSDEIGLSDACPIAAPQSLRCLTLHCHGNLGTRLLRGAPWLQHLAWRLYGDTSLPVVLVTLPSTLRSLHLANLVAPTGLASLSRLQQLEELSLHDGHFWHNFSLNGLATMPRLRVLELNGTMRHWLLHEALPAVRELRLHSMKNEHGLVLTFLHHMRNLEVLHCKPLEELGDVDACLRLLPHLHTLGLERPMLPATMLPNYLHVVRFTPLADLGFSWPPSHVNFKRVL